MRVFQRLAQRMRANYDRIETWAGTYRFDERTYYEGDAPPAAGPAPDPDAQARPYWGKVGGRIRFAVDVRSDSLFTMTECDHPMRYEDAETGKLISVHAGRKSLQYSIVTPHKYVHFQPGRTYKASPAHPRIGAGRMVMEQDPSNARPAVGITNHVVDPREGFNIDGTRFWDRCDFYARSLLGRTSEGGLLSPELKQAAENSFFIAKQEEGGAVSYRMTDQSGPRDPVEEIHFDGAVGFHPVYYRSIGPVFNKGGRIGRSVKVFQWKYSFDKHAGVYVPSQIRIALKHGDSISFERVLRLVESTVNAPLDPATFTYRNLGLQNGDRYWDQRRNVVLVYHDGELKESLPAD